MCFFYPVSIHVKSLHGSLKNKVASRLSFYCSNSEKLQPQHEEPGSTMALGHQIVERRPCLLPLWWGGGGDSSGPGHQGPRCDQGLRKGTASDSGDSWDFILFILFLPTYEGKMEISSSFPTSKIVLKWNSENQWYRHDTVTGFFQNNVYFIVCFIPRIRF